MSDGSGIKQVKVDNWGIFFLQRLQQFFTRSEFCDLILQFSNNEQVKVHRLVLNACTEYFQTLERQGHASGNCLLHMPGDLQADVVVPIINFMYSGRLEFRPELHSRLYTTAQQMNMTVLTKLLDAQAMPAAQNPKPYPVKKMGPLPVTWNLQGKKILPKIEPGLPDPLPGRKLPIWKRRSAPPTVPSFFSEPVHMNHHDVSTRVSLPRYDEVARPTRFEWPDGDDDDVQLIGFTSSFDDLSYETKPLIRSQSVPKPAPLPTPPAPITQPYMKQECPNVSFEEIRRTAVCIKRPAVSESDDADSKKPKVMDLQAVKEYVEEHRLRKDLLDSEENSEDVEDDMAVADMDDDDDDMDDENDIPRGVLSGPAPVPPLSKPPSILPVTTPQKSILKSPHEDSLSIGGSASKKVRFTLDQKSNDGKENTVEEQAPVPVAKPLPTRMTEVSSSAPGNPGNLSNHAKIITEVLKKYPHLVRNNKNIRLKIMQRGSGGQSSAPSITADVEGSKVVKSKVSYLVLKSEVASKGKQAVVLKHGEQVEAISELGNQRTVSGAENTTGPWLCHSCGTNEEPINFPTYYQYRRHLQDVHNEKIDARICEHCGHRASKRNLLLYHLYTRHNIPPPRNCQFPKCDQCDYVALSESLLIKHRNNHSNNKEFVCKVCNATFKSNGALQGHMQTNLHSDPAKKLYECPFCLKPFVRNINLKAHMRTAHKKLDEEVGNSLDNQHVQFNLQDSEDGEEIHTSGIMNHHMGLGSVMKVPVINTLTQPKTEPTSVVLAPTMTVLTNALTNGTAIPAGMSSSEAEAFNNVAHGIAASLGLENALTEQTVILLDENQEYVFHTTEVVREETASTEIQDYIEEVPIQEYIVPEIIGSEEQPYNNKDQTFSSDDQVYVSKEQEYIGEEQTYASQLSNYSGQTPNSHSGNKTCALNATQSTTSSATTTTSLSSPTSPPAVSVPPSTPSTSQQSPSLGVPEAEDIALVLSDHDYAEDITQKEQCSTESMMFIITQPMMDGTGVTRIIQQPMHALSSLQMENVTVVDGNSSTVHQNILIPQVIKDTQYSIPQVVKGTQFNLPQVVKGTQFNLPHIVKGTQFNLPHIVKETKFNKPQAVKRIQYNPPQVVKETTFNLPQAIKETQFNLPSFPQLVQGEKFNLPQVMKETEYNVPQTLEQVQYTLSQVVGETRYEIPQIVEGTQYNISKMGVKGNHIIIKNEPQQKQQFIEEEVQQQSVEKVHQNTKEQLQQQQSLSAERVQQLQLQRVEQVQQHIAEQVQQQSHSAERVQQLQLQSVEQVQQHNAEQVQQQQSHSAERVQQLQLQSVDQVQQQQHCVEQVQQLPQQSVEEQEHHSVEQMHLVEQHNAGQGQIVEQHTAEQQDHHSVENGHQLQEHSAEQVHQPTAELQLHGVEQVHQLQEHSVEQVHQLQEHSVEQMHQPTAEQLQQHSVEQVHQLQLQEHSAKEVQHSVEELHQLQEHSAEQVQGQLQESSAEQVHQHPAKQLLQHSAEQLQQLQRAEKVHQLQHRSVEQVQQLQSVGQMHQLQEHSEHLRQLQSVEQVHQLQEHSEHLQQLQSVEQVHQLPEHSEHVQQLQSVEQVHQLQEHSEHLQLQSVEQVHQLQGHSEHVQQLQSVEQVQQHSVEQVHQLQLQNEQVQLTTEPSSAASEEVQTAEPHISISQSPIRTYSPTKKVHPTTLPARGIPIEQMADLVKEWDEFDEDSCEDMNRSETHSRIETG